MDNLNSILVPVFFAVRCLAPLIGTALSVFVLYRYKIIDRTVCELENIYILALSFVFYVGVAMARLFINIKNIFRINSPVFAIGFEDICLLIFLLFVMVVPTNYLVIRRVGIVNGKLQFSVSMIICAVNVLIYLALDFIALRKLYLM
jgi:hypothetical protein